MNFLNSSLQLDRSSCDDGTSQDKRLLYDNSTRYERGSLPALDFAKSKKTLSPVLVWISLKQSEAKLRTDFKRLDGCDQQPLTRE